MSISADVFLHADFSHAIVRSGKFSPSLQVDGAWFHVDSSKESAQLLAAARELHAHVVAFEDNAVVGSLVQSARDAAAREVVVAGEPT